MSEYFVTTAILLVPTFVAFRIKSLYVAFSVPLLGILSTGMIVHCSYFFGIKWTSNLVRLLFIVSLVACSTLAIRVGRNNTERSLMKQFVAVGLPALGIFGFILYSRITAKNQLHGLLTSIHFIIKEDNAKWTNVTSLITQGKFLGIVDIGGVLTAYLVVCQSVIKTIFPILRLDTSEISLSISTVVCGQLGLIIASPLFLLPITKILNNNRNIWKSIPGFWLSSLVIAGGSAAFQSFGHLSSQLVLVVGVYSIGLLLTSGTISHDGELITFIGLFCLVATSSIWLPYQLLTGVIPLIALGVFISLRLRSHRLDIAVFASIPLMLSLMAIPIAVDTFNYLTLTDTNLQNLLVAGGATHTATPVLLLLPVFLLFSTLMARDKLVSAEHTISDRESNYENYTILAFVGLFTVVVIYFDYLRSGFSNYGSLKVQFMCSLFLLITLIPIAITKVTNFEVPTRGFIVSCACSSLLLFAVSSDVTFSSLPQKFRSQQWPENAAWSKDLNWQAWITDMSENRKKLSEIPIACGEFIADEPYWNVNGETYVCTRQLHALAGLESTAGALVEWQLRGDWAKSVGYLRALPENIKSRNVLVLTEGKVVGMVQLDEYLSDDSAHKVEN